MHLYAIPIILSIISFCKRYSQGKLCFAQFHTRTYRNSFAVCDLFLIFTELINYYTFLLKNTYV